MKKKSHISYRIAKDLWYDDAQFEALCSVFAENRAGYDDLALFDSSSHSVLALDEVARNAEVIRRRCAELRRRRLGERIGINLLCTMGHHPENLKLSPQDGRFQKLTGIDGVTVDGCFCINCQDYRQEHLRQLFTILAQCGIDFLWLDDDLRFYGHGAAGLVCFCDGCIARFNQAHQTVYTRETLRAAFSQGDWREELKLRRQWLAFSGESLRSLFAFAAACVHQVNPAIQMGAMDGGMRAGDSASYEALARALQHDPDRSPLPRWRPGGGAYTDFQLFEEMVLVKATQLGAAADWMPEFMTDLEAEIESFNYQRLRKSRCATAFEGALYCAAGMTGAAWNVLTGGDDPEVNPPLIHALTAVRPFYDRVVSANGRLPQRGICALWKPGQAAVSNLTGSWEENFRGNASKIVYSELFGSGFPQAFRPEAADLFLLTGNTVYDYSDQELRAFFRRGVYCDAATLRGLEQRGLSSLAGFRCGAKISADAIEVLTDHPLNGADAGCRRNGHQSFARFWGDDGGVFALEPIPGMESRCETLAELCDYNNTPIAPCSMGFFLNESGGRVVVAGYYPGTNLLFAFKLRQLRAIFNALSSGGAMSAWVDSYHRVKVFVRRDETRRRAVIELANASEDPAESVVLRVRDGAGSAILTTADLQQAELTGRRVDDGTAEYVIDRLAPWSVNLIEMELA